MPVAKKRKKRLADYGRKGVLLAPTHQEYEILKAAAKLENLMLTQFIMSRCLKAASEILQKSA